MLRPILLALLLLSPASFAATESTSLDVSLTVRESCRVERHEREPAAPEVSCALDSPYRVQNGDGAYPPPSRSRLSPARWEVIF